MHLLATAQSNERHTVHVLQCSDCSLCLGILNAPSCSEIILKNKLKIFSTGYIVVAVVGSYCRLNSSLNFTGVGGVALTSRVRACAPSTDHRLSNSVRLVWPATA